MYTFFLKIFLKLNVIKKLITCVQKLTWEQCQLVEYLFIYCQFLIYSKQFEASLVLLRNSYFFMRFIDWKKSLFYANSKSSKTSVSCSIETCWIKRENRYPLFIKSQDIFHPK